MIRIPPASRAAAESTLTDRGAVTSPGTDTVSADGTVTAGTASAVWSGYCSLSPATHDQRTGTLGDDRIIGALVARLPAAAGTCSTTTGDPTAVAVGHTLTVNGIEYVVRRVSNRSTEVLRRLLVQRAVDAEQVPR